MSSSEPGKKAGILDVVWLIGYGILFLIGGAFTIVMFALAVFFILGPPMRYADPMEKVLLAGIALVCGALAWISGRLISGKPIIPKIADSQVEEPESDDAEEIFEQIGLPLDSLVTDEATALVRAIPRAALAQAYRSLQAGQLDEAMSAVMTVIGRAEYEDDPEVMAAAHYLRANVHEQMDKKSEAITDYEQALALSPDHEGAQAGLARMKES